MGVEGAVAAEAQQLLRQVGTALRRVLHVVEFAAGRHRSCQPAGAPQDRAEDFAELLRDGACQPGDCLHLLGLP